MLSSAAIVRRCSNPGCPFRVRHGFAAEFIDDVELCRSCGKPLEAITVPEPPAASAMLDVLGRLGVTLGVGVALVLLGRAPVPGSELEPRASLAVAALWPALGAWLIARGVTSALPARPALRVVVLPLALVLTVVAQLLGPWPLADGLGDPARMALQLGALPLLVALVGLIDRWGVGSGLSTCLVALLLVPLVGPRPDLPTLAMLIGLTFAAAAVLAPAVRPTSQGRQPLTRIDEGQARDGDLGLGLVTPTSGLLPLLVPLGLVALIDWLGVDSLAATLEPHLGALGLLGTLGLTLLLGAAFTRPSRLVELWQRAFPRASKAELERVASGLFRRGLIRSALLLGVGTVLASEDLPVLAAILLAAILLDWGHELRFRLDQAERGVELVALPGVGDLHETRALVQALALARVDSTIKGERSLALLAGLGSTNEHRLLLPASMREQAEAERERLTS